MWEFSINQIKVEEKVRPTWQNANIAHCYKRLKLWKNKTKRVEDVLLKA